jgi:hypothetical protein
VPVPVLLLPAERDHADPRAGTRQPSIDEALATLPKARLRPFVGDHDIHAQHPAEVADVMIDALDDGFLA